MKRTLRELDGAFLKVLSKGSLRTDATFEEAEGVMFLCPKCFKANNGPVGTHTVICWFEGVSDEMSPGPGRWVPSAQAWTI